MFSYNNRRLGPVTNQPVSLTRLIACGESNWTLQSRRFAQDRFVVLFNASPSFNLNVYLMTPENTIANSNLIDVLPPLTQGIYLVQSGDQILVNRDAASTDTATAYERLAR